MDKTNESSDFSFLTNKVDQNLVIVIMVGLLAGWFITVQVQQDKIERLEGELKYKIDQTAVINREPAKPRE